MSDLDIMAIADECTHDFDGNPIDRQHLIASLEADQEVFRKHRAGKLTIEEVRQIIWKRKFGLNSS